MTLDDLYCQVVPMFSPSTQKDLKTAVNLLAHALAYSDPKSCPLEACQQIVTSLNTPDGRHLIHFASTFDAYLIAHGKGTHTIRNTKNNLSRLWRSAASQGLLHLVAEIPTSRFHRRNKPSRPGSEVTCNDGSHLPYYQWPTSLKSDFEAFAQWATNPLVPGREARWKKRLCTVAHYQTKLAGYFGFLHHIYGVPEVSFHQIFDLSLIRAYVDWHVNKKFKRATVTIHDFMKCIKALTRQYQPQPELFKQLHNLHKSLPKPTPTYQKNDAWIPLVQLRQIGEALWPQKPPEALHRNGYFYAARAGLSIIFQLWTYIPYRQRNIREMQLGTNLYQDSHKIWRLRFAGEQLKIAVRRGQPNIFHLPFPERLVPRLEAYLTIWRPLFLKASTPPPSEVFLNAWGLPWARESLRTQVASVVYRYTGKHWHPHMIRTVWTTEYIRETGDFFNAAIMLNDTLETVIKTYAHLRDENVATKVYQWVDAPFTTGGTP